MNNKVIFWFLWIFGVIMGIAGTTQNSEDNITRAFILLTGSVIIQCIKE